MGDMNTQLGDLPRGLSIEEFWAVYQEMSRETDRKMQETDRELKETGRLIKELTAKTDRQMEETDRKISRLGDRLGDLIEHLTASNLPEKFEEFNYKFTLISRNIKIKDDANRILAEIDILLENGDYAMAVEVKSLLTKTGVKEHIKRMETLRRYADLRHDRRKYISSVSGALIEKNAKDFALKKGIYVIEHPGEAVQIAVPATVQIW